MCRMTTCAVVKTSRSLGYGVQQTHNLQIGVQSVRFDALAAVSVAGTTFGMW
jgi:hypothetical protein